MPRLDPRQRHARNIQHRLDGSLYRLRLNRDVSARDISDEDTEEQAEEESSVRGGLLVERRRGGGLFARNRRAQRGVEAQLCSNSQSLRAMVRAVAGGCGREWSQA